jgi:hypothetical protein
VSEHVHCGGQGSRLFSGELTFVWLLFFAHGGDFTDGDAYENAAG